MTATLPSRLKIALKPALKGDLLIILTYPAVNVNLNPSCYQITSETELLQKIKIQNVRNITTDTSRFLVFRHAPQERAEFKS